MARGQGLESYAEFLREVQEVEDLLDAEVVEKSLPGESGRLSKSKKRKSLCRASMVMLVAHFEGFIKGALYEFVDEICFAKPPSRRLPGEFLELFTGERVREIASLGDQKERITKTRKIFATYSDLWDDERSINPKLISAKVLARQFTNAGPDSLEGVLDLLGIVDSLNRIEASLCDQYASLEEDGGSGVKVRDKLKEIVDKRNNIAHGDVDEMSTEQEIRAYMKFLSDVGFIISEMIKEKVDCCCSLR